MLLIAAACVVVVPGVASAAKAKTVTVKGFTVEYGVAVGTVKPLPGTKISVAEYPKLKTVTKANGSFSIKVPAKAKVTIVADAAGHLITYSPTRVRLETDRPRIFYLPTLALTRGLSALLAIPTNADQTASKDCVIGLSVINKAASKYTTPYQDAGNLARATVPGSKVRMSPSKGTWAKPIYFGAGGIPDRTLTSTGLNGGPLFVGVPAGTYTITASKAGSKFDSWTATCKPGRYVLGTIYQL